MQADTESKTGEESGSPRKMTMHAAYALPVLWTNDAEAPLGFCDIGKLTPAFFSSRGVTVALKAGECVFMIVSVINVVRFELTQVIGAGDLTESNGEHPFYVYINQAKLEQLISICKFIVSQLTFTDHLNEKWLIKAVRIWMYIEANKCNCGKTILGNLIAMTKWLKNNHGIHKSAQEILDILLALAISRNFRRSYSNIPPSVVRRKTAGKPSISTFIRGIRRHKGSDLLKMDSYHSEAGKMNYSLTVTYDTLFDAFVYLYQKASQDKLRHMRRRRKGLAMSGAAYQHFLQNPTKFWDANKKEDDLDIGESTKGRILKG